MGKRYCEEKSPSKSLHCDLSLWRYGHRKLRNGAPLVLINRCGSDGIGAFCIIEMGTPASGGLSTQKGHGIDLTVPPQDLHPGKVLTRNVVLKNETVRDTDRRIARYRKAQRAT